MKIYKVKSTEDKTDQQWQMVYDCQNHWRRLNNTNYAHYPEIMNMKIYRRNHEHWCDVALTYHFNLNKW